ncbi:uncharacterized protein LOC124459678 [Drosophila willistoni]|uniref:uncharacterized protein LOC124459678 n=1 Tax=Drosophila willistoni TaxID=7260 RepID=UPI001F0803E2|nr:uncharacterized protein LOC124459678 [Drosophila willistoni]
MWVYKCVLLGQTTVHKFHLQHTIYIPTIMSAIRFVLISLALLVMMTYAQPVPGAPAIDPSLPGVEATLPPSHVVDREPKPRTLFLLLPLLFPSEFYWS